LNRLIGLSAKCIANRGFKDLSKEILMNVEMSMSDRVFCDCNLIMNQEFGMMSI